jgi:two-component SAPR family response regulator
VTKPKAKRVLIVEDEVLVAMHLEDLLTEMGHQVIGSCGRLNEAMALARDAEIDFAVLDINLAGAQSFPVADILRQRGIPFVFTSGYGSEGLVDDYHAETTLRKPYEPQALKHVIERIFPEITR